jgi:tRNA (mo5U34)-methyltransferase
MKIHKKIDDFLEHINSDINLNLSQWIKFNLVFFDNINHGSWPELIGLLSELPEIPEEIDCKLNQSIVSVQSDFFIDHSRLYPLLKKLSPWRKGPFSLYGIFIDTEWRSDAKWARLAPHLASLTHRRVLDVGTGSGYHLWRMLGAGAHCVVGIEPTVTFVAQFYAVAHLLGESRALIIPTTLEETIRKPIFDTVFSMGVLYHRRSPIHHLQELGECLRPGGELVLETLIVESHDQNVLTPEDRYAGMRNVWFIPSIPLLTVWLMRSGYIHIRVVSLEHTSFDEQRATEWTDFKHSLVDFLDSINPKKTIEGYPAPLRAIIIANKK